MDPLPDVLPLQMGQFSRLPGQQRPLCAGRKDPPVPAPGINSDQAESWHSWSSNSRWIVLRVVPQDLQRPGTDPGTDRGKVKGTGSGRSEAVEDSRAQRGGPTSST